MTVINKTDTGESQNVTRKYEILRANALGDINRAAEFIFFLKNGMSAWFYALQGQCFDRLEIHRKNIPTVEDQDVGIPEVGLVAILVDATLQSLRAADCRR